MCSRKGFISIACSRAVQPCGFPLFGHVFMSGFFLILMGIAMAALLGTLFIGVFSMAKGGEFNKKYGNKLMKLRVALQAVALVFFLLAVLSSAKS